MQDDDEQPPQPQPRQQGLLQGSMQPSEHLGGLHAHADAAIGAAPGTDMDPASANTLGTHAATTRPVSEALDDFSSIPELVTMLQQLNEHTADPTAFLRPSDRISHAARHTAKGLLDYVMHAMSDAGAHDKEHATSAASASSTAALTASSQLHVSEGFDAEQVWLQLDMQTAPLLGRVKRLIKNVQDSGVSSIVPAGVEKSIDDILQADGAGSDEDQEQSELEEGRHECTTLVCMCLCLLSHAIHHSIKPKCTYSLAVKIIA